MARSRRGWNGVCLRPPVNVKGGGTPTRQALGFDERIQTHYINRKETSYENEMHPSRDLLRTRSAHDRRAFGSITENAEQQELKVDLNQASASELQKLPGVGEKVAQRILEYREANGPFGAPEELMNVRGIGEKTYMNLEAYVTLSNKTQKKK